MNRIARSLLRAERRSDFVSLINTNFHSCGLYPDEELLRAAIGRALDPPRREYAPDPAGLRGLRQAVARYYADSGVVVGPESIVVTASASESYRHVFTGHCARGGEVLLPRPGYPLFEEVALRCGLNPRSYDLDPAAGWRVDTASLVALIGPTTTAVVLISPNNPTGSVVDEETVRAIGAVCAEHDVALVVDEVFSEYRFAAGGSDEVARLPRPAALCPEALVFTINGASKLLASPDLKVSWIAVSGPTGRREAAMEELEIENDLYLDASPINQHAVAELLDARERVWLRLVEVVGRRRAAMLAELESIAERHPGRLSWVEPAGGIHLPVFVEGDGGLDDEEIAVRLLDRHALSVHPGYLYGVESPTMLVLSYLAPEAIIREGMLRIESFVSALRTT